MIHLTAVSLPLLAAVLLAGCAEGIASTRPPPRSPADEPTNTGGGDGTGMRNTSRGGNPVPEPTTLLMVGAGVAGMTWLRRRARQQGAAAAAEPRR